MQGTISLPKCIKQGSDEKDFIQNVYPDNVLDSLVIHGDFFRERAILCSKNDDAMAINKLVSDKVTGSKVVLYSEDNFFSDASDDDEAITYPAEYLHARNLAGLPPHELELKVGLPAMLLRNLEPSRDIFDPFDNYDIDLTGFASLQ